MTDDAANEVLDALSSCQCCLLGRQQKSLKTMYYHLGRTEIYSDMLKECFDIRLSVGSEKSGICEECVGHLRDASNFKQQVQRSQLELQNRLKRALGILEEEPFAAVKRETDKSKTSYILLDEESTVELSDDDEASPVMCEGDIKSEETEEDGTRDCPPGEGDIKSEETDEDGTRDCPPEEPAAVVKSEIDEDDDGTNGDLSDENQSIKSEQPDEGVTSDEDLPPVCSLSARAREQLAMTCSVRLERLTGLEAHACHMCHMTFEHESSLATHMMEHDDNQIHTDTYICDVCKQQFTLKGDLEKHISTHTREKRFNCEICFKSFSCRLYLRRHVQRHTAQKTFKCEICYKSFSSRDYLRQHVLVHSAQKPFKCEICYKSFSGKCYLQRHDRIHDTAQKPFKCETCYKSFSCRKYLGKHALRHSAQKPFKCEICYKSFSWRCELKRHVNIHTGEKPYSCDMCNRQFTDKSSMKRHVVFTLHAFKCDICNKQFARQDELLTHVTGTCLSNIKCVTSNPPKRNI